MQKPEIWITQGYLALIHPEMPQGGRHLLLEVGQQPFEQLPALLADVPPAHEPVWVNLVLGPSLCSYLALDFPRLSKSKLKKIIQFEAESQLLGNLEDYHWNFQDDTSKNSDRSRVGVYAVESQRIQGLQEKLKNLNWRLGELTPLYSRIRGNSDGGDQLELLLDQGACHFLVRQGGSLTEAGYLGLRGDWATNLLGINRQIRGILLEHPGLPVCIRGDWPQLKLEENGELSLLQEIPEVVPLYRKNQFLLKTGVNLGRAEGWDWTLLKERLQRFRKVGFLALACFVLFAMGRGYGIYQEMARLQELEAKRDEIARRLAPGVPGDQALIQVKQLLSKLNKPGMEAVGFLEGSYPMSRNTQKISSLKTKAPSLEATRLTINDRNISLQGQVSNQAELEALNQMAEQNYPPARHEVRITQKPQEGGKVSFTLTLSKKP